MSTAITKNATRAQMLNMLFFGSLAIVLAAMIAMDTDKLQRFIVLEINEVREAFSEKDFKSLEARVRDRHQVLLYDSGFFDGVRERFVPKERGESGASALGNRYLYQWVNNLQVISYQALFRLTILEYWFFSMLPMVVALLGTGYYNWRIKGYYMGGTHANIMRLYLKAVWFLFAGLITYIVFPNFLNLHNPFVPPILIFLMALLMSRIITNYQKM